MTHIKQIIDVESVVKNVKGTSHSTIRITFCRTNFERVFTLDLIKNREGNWEKHELNVQRQKGQSIKEQLKELEKTNYQIKWDVVIQELLVHPKVRLHTLY